MSKQSFQIENHFYTFTMKFGPDPKFDVIDDVIMITSIHQVRCQKVFDRGRPLPCHKQSNRCLFSDYVGHDNE